MATLTGGPPVYNQQHIDGSISRSKLSYLCQALGKLPGGKTGDSLPAGHVLLGWSAVPGIDESPQR